MSSKFMKSAAVLGTATLASVLLVARVAVPSTAALFMKLDDIVYSS